MSAGIELNFDAYPTIHGWAEKERELLRTALEERPGNDGEDYLAAMELLFKYVDGSNFAAPDVRAAVERGVRQVTRKVVEQGRTEVSPLMYFGRFGKARTPPHGVRVARLEQRIRENIHLTERDARIALTQEYRTKTRAMGKPPAREDWPDTVGEVEHMLIDYVLWRFLKKASAPEEVGQVDKSDRLKVATGKEFMLARRYVRDSFYWLPWTQEHETVDYPTSW